MAETPIQKLLRSDGALCLTFVNTGLGTRPELESYADLLAWGVEAGALDAGDASRLESAAARRPGPAAGVARRTKTLRARLERLLTAAASGRRPNDTDLRAFSTELGAALSHRRVVTAGSGFGWSWTADGDEDAGRVLWPILLSTGELLTSEDLGRLRQCPADRCGILFIARASGRPRKWCSRACRDRASSIKHYHRRIKPRRETQASLAQAQQRARLAGFGWQSGAPERPEEPEDT